MSTRKNPRLSALSPLLASGLALMISCTGEEEPEVVEDPCPMVEMENLAGDWYKVAGPRADHKNRFRIKGTLDGGYDAWLVPGFFSKLTMKGTRRENDIMFDQVLTPEREREFKEGLRMRHRLYVEPFKRSCSLRVVLAQVMVKNGKETERPRQHGFEEYLDADRVGFPPDTVFTFQPPDGPLFLGAAARNRRVAEGQMKEIGEPKPDHSFGESIPVGFFSQADQDGPATCTYEMDLFFDDRPYTGRSDSPDPSRGEAVPAGEVKDGWRHWYIPDWFAPFSGNHNFEMFRYRKCGGERELIAVQGLEAILT